MQPTCSFVYSSRVVYIYTQDLVVQWAVYAKLISSCSSGMLIAAKLCHACSQDFTSLTDVTIYLVIYMYIFHGERQVVVDSLLFACF